MRGQGRLIGWFACAILGVPALAAEAQLEYVMGTKPDALRGARLYETCAACHGRRGEGVSDGSVPAIGGQHYLVIVKQLTDFRAELRSDMRMQHFADTSHLSYSQQIADVSGHISSLPLPAPSAAIPGDVLSRGGAVYAQRCERCHGATGQGNGESFVPRIAAQHAVYLRQQLDAAATGRRLSMIRSHADFARTLSDSDKAAVVAYLAGSESFAP
jgi:cytochrome c553